MNLEGLHGVEFWARSKGRDAQSVRYATTKPYPPTFEDHEAGEAKDWMRNVSDLTELRFGEAHFSQLQVSELRSPRFHMRQVRKLLYDISWHAVALEGALGLVINL